MKICGITSLRDALDAVEVGADALGFNFFEESRRYIKPVEASRIIRQLPPFVSVVGLFVNPTAETVQQALFEMRIDYLQFHGDESRDFISRFPLEKVIRGFRIKGKESFHQMAAYEGCAAFLLDAHVDGAWGGTGKSFNWELMVEAAVRFKSPLILAGGLNENNVASAVEVTRPWAVDVAGGVEISPGKKDKERMRIFVQQAKSIRLNEC